MKMKCVRGLDLKVMKSGAGYYIGTEYADPDMGGAIVPNCRMTDYMTKEKAERLLEKGDAFALWDASRDCAENGYCAGGSCIDLDEEATA